MFLPNYVCRAMRDGRFSYCSLIYALSNSLYYPLITRKHPDQKRNKPLNLQTICLNKTRLIKKFDQFKK